MQVRRSVAIDLLIALLVGLVVVFVAAGFLGGGDVNRLIPDTDKIERGLVEGDLGDDDVVGAACPHEGLKASGDNMECRVTLADGSERRVRVELLNDEGWLSFELLRG